MDVGLREAPAEVAEVALEEHRVLRAPHEERGTVEGGDVRAHALQLGMRGMVLVDGDVGDEPADPVPQRRGLVGRAEGRTDLGGELAEAQRHPKEAVGDDGGRRQHGAGERGPQRGRERCVLGLVDGGVEADRGRDPVGVPGRPPEREDTAPVMADRHDGMLRPRLGGVGCGTAGRLGEEGCDDGIEIGDALGDAAHLGAVRGRQAVMGQTLGEPHVELVGGDEPPRAPTGARGFDGGRGEATPQKRPRRIAVEGEDRAGRFDPLGAQGRQRVEDVERMRVVAGVDLDDPGPRGIPFGQRRGKGGRPSGMVHRCPTTRSRSLRC